MSGPAKEIERKFLVREVPPNLFRDPGKRIEQGYVAVDPDGTEVRLRKKGERCFLTIKSGAGLERLEAETELTPDQYDTLWPMTEGRRLVKIRHEVPHGALTIEVDVYLEQLSGFHTAEVEFASREESRAFDPPAWMAEEVTGDERYLNRNLATRG